MSLLPGFSKLAFSLFLVSSFLFLVTNPTFAQPATPDPKPCENTLYTDKLTKIVLEPQVQQLSATDLPGNPGEIQHTFTFHVDFSKLSAIFAQPNSDYPEGRFQDAAHRQTDILSLDQPSFNLFHGPGQKVAPKVMVDQLKQKYVKYISEKPQQAESGNLYFDISGQNPKTIFDLVSTFGEPNPPSLGGNREVWLTTWGQYWEKIPTAVSEFYYGIFTYAVIEGEKGLKLLEEKGECPGKERRVFFVLPEYFRTASIANQLNNLVVPAAAQSSEEKFVDQNLLVQTANDTKNALAKFIQACLKPFKNLSLGSPLKKIIGLDFLHIVKDVYAAAVAPNPFNIPPVEKCPKPIAPLPDDKEGSGPFCSVPEFIYNTPNLNEGECQNVESPNKLDEGTNVKCTFQRNYQRAPLIGTEKDPGVWDSCTPTNDGSGRYTCTLTVRVYPIFYIPWLAPIWNNTTYSDENDKEAIFGDGKTGKEQETGRPGVYTLFKPNSVDFTVFPEGKNLPSKEQGAADELKQRFLGAADDNKVFSRDRALKPCALQEYLGIEAACKTGN